MSGKQQNKIINAGIGFEHYAYLSKNWNVFVGIDAV